MKKYKLERKFNRHLHSIGNKINQLDNNFKNIGKEREKLKTQA
jgi:ferritin-like metal-binding protein YciE